MLLSAFLLSLCPGLSISWSQVGDLRFEDRRLATIPDEISLEGEPMTGPNGETIEVRTPVHWSPDGRQVAYVGFKGGERCAVVGEHVSKAHDYIDSISFGDSGDDVVFRVGDRVSKKKEKWFLYRGPDQKKKPKSFDWIGAPAMSPDGSRVVVWNQPGAKLDSEGYYQRKDVELYGAWKKRGKGYDDGLLLSPPVFAEDSSRVFSVMQQHGTWLVLMIDKKGEHTLIKDMMAVADFAVDSAGGKVAVSEIRYPLSQSEPTFKFEGLPAASVEIRLDDDVLGKDFDAAWAPSFSPSGKQLAYKVMKDGRMGVSANDESKARLDWDFVTRPVVSLDGQRVAFVGSQDTVFSYGSPTQRGAGARERTGTEQVHVFPIQTPEKCEPVGDSANRIEQVQFGPHDDQIAYVARSDDGWRVHCGKFTSETFDEVGPLHFDEQGKVIGFGARSGRELLWRTLVLGD